MTRKELQLTPPEELRRKAEELEKNTNQTLKDPATLSPVEIQGMLHELRVHQIQLEMQNDELRRIQEELDISRERYFDLYDLAPVGYCTLNEGGMIIESNLTLITLLGMHKRLFVKKQFSRFILSVDQDLFYQFFKRLKTTKDFQEGELRMLRADKSTFWVKITATASEEKEGPPAYRVVLVDITEQKLAQLAIKSLNEELENRVKHRTHELENSTNAMKSFSYTVSHDLRSPLRAIDGFSAILIDNYKDQLGVEGNRFLHVIRENAKQMNQLIVDLLELAKATNYELKKNLIDMNRLVDTVYQEIVEEEDQKKITLTIDPLIDCFGDPHLIRQVWVNLIVNAVKFSQKQAHSSILIQSYQTQDQIVYLIKDNGCGFNPAYKNKLFTAFQRLHTNTEYEGTGIGLVLVEQIIHRHGGKVWAEGIEGVGATFYFSLPTKE
jgi:PAS domain S-box-containing protein